MNTNKVLFFAAISALTVGCAAQRTTGGLVDTSKQYATSNNVTAPPSAKPGECYINLHTKPVTEQVSQQVLRRAASKKIEVVPATYANGEETVLVKPAGTRLEVVPVTYDTAEEQVLVKSAGSRLLPVDAVYENKAEQVLVSEASTYWKRSTVAEASNSGAKEQIAGDDGYVMCLIEKPAVYKTVNSKVMVSGPSTREEVIPAEYDTATSTRTVSAGSWEWRRILCATNSTLAKLQEIESALSAAGQNPGNVDGVVDSNTLTALQAYQTSKGLPVDHGRYINIDTIKSLGIASQYIC